MKPTTVATSALPPAVTTQAARSETRDFQEVPRVQEVAQDLSGIGSMALNAEATYHDEHDVGDDYDLEDEEKE